MEGDLATNSTKNTMLLQNFLTFTIDLLHSWHFGLFFRQMTTNL